jgi:alginate O-acetyltransferase complex protein AlgI
MNFTSPAFFALFLPASVLLFAACRNAILRQYLLIGLSLLFYGLSGQSNLTVLLASIGLNLLYGKLLTRPVDLQWPGRVVLLWLAVATNIGCLLTFKILAVSISDGQGFRTAQDILIPLALSFVTFQQIGFVYACYKRQIKQVSIANYLFFIAFFPQLIIGPIVRFQDMDRQVREGRLTKFSADNLAIGLSIFLFGLTKKILFADQLFVPVDLVFQSVQTGPVATGDMWFAIFAFQLQLFLDFTAYADMAIGIARMFNIDLPINFDRAFKARDRFDLWRRWHITFAVFMRTHVFFPLVRKAKIPIGLAMALTGFLSGLWHGLGWNFIVWGLAQSALMLLIHERNKRFSRRVADTRTTVVRAISITFLTNALLGVIFRTPTLSGMQNVYSNLFDWTAFFGHNSLIEPKAWAMMVISAFMIWVWPDTPQFFQKFWTAIDLRNRGARPPGYEQAAWISFDLNRRWAIVGGALLVSCLISAGDSTRFIYVQF